MYKLCKIYVTHHAKRDLVGIIDPSQLAQSVKAEQGQNFLLLADFLCINPLPDNKI